MLLVVVFNVKIQPYSSRRSKKKKHKTEKMKQKKKNFKKSDEMCVRVCFKILVRVSLFFLSLSLSLSLNDLLHLLSRCSLPRDPVADPRQIQRILRPSVLDTLFRASSFRTRGALCNEPKRYRTTGREALSPLRLSI